MAFPAKKHYNRAGYVICLGDSRLAREAGHDDRFYCARPGCGPMSGPQCSDCEGYTMSNIPPFKCFNRKGYEMILGDDGKYYCGKQYASLTAVLGFNGGRCHPSKNWQCKHCMGFSTGSSEPPLHNRREISVPEKCEANPFKNKNSKNHDI
mmetsp:Transcript_40124/g.29607  ORF Transcript_40124/g.29607 Transcript_40124/m.29607 type:complete len:151 (+) Transcript_40124:70-522(+)|eukprot:CAMPEP_0202970814 /NCGR_PEP_ID=MMETSP1396-20130829/20579_1 /ASSEMBLY_ACC=CAM_ASM_000872 /TAXON_ID= /ORGANISM="Pseudokeronopsis sp., Strain Brazil" /LENGTH=150 /DNA_ID=CAMNT_0049699595 /DNA_START=37 /DNA_END=489 /DNA_ORIENTATION=+